MRILEVFLQSADIRSTIVFYRDILELHILQESTHGVSIKAGHTVLHFRYVENLEPVYHFAFNIPANQLDSALRFLQSKIEIMPALATGELVADFKSWNAKSFYFNDNNGNILECIARLDLDNSTAGWNPATFILNISEIAFVVEDIPETQRYLYKRGIPLFDKGPQTDDFSVLGDEEGLIILKDRLSGWMPNNLTPMPFETRALIQQESMRFELSFFNEELEIRQED